MLHALLALTIVAAAPDAAVDFDTQIMPVLTKAGCNAGACHGAAVGRGGFRLSLWGSNPGLDHERIVHELEGRRLDLARPAQSLLLLKSTEQLEHEGGLRFAFDSEQAETIERWIASGARRLADRKLVRLKIEPTQIALNAPGDEFDLRVVAEFSDGDVEDVVRQAVVTAADDGALEIADSGRVTALRRGLHTLVARYLDRVTAVSVIVPLSDRPVDLASELRTNFVDDEVVAMLEELRIPPSPPARDAEFLRRAWLALCGALPPPETVREFLADPRPDKRERLVDKLLGSPQYVDFWALKWSQLFRVRSSAMDREGVAAFHAWLRDRVADNTPIDKLTKALIVADGDAHTFGPANFARAVPGPREQAELVSETLLGVRLRCANCHDHPLDRWTQDDYHGLAAIFASLERGRFVRVGAPAEVIHPRTGEPATPRLPSLRFLPTTIDARRILADFVVAPDNRLFPRAAVNRIWKQLMGRGLVEPIDDLRATNPPTHEKLLDRLAADFVDHGYDAQRTMRLIASSAAFARSGAAFSGNQADDRFYSHALPRPLDAEVLADALAEVTGVADEFGDPAVAKLAVTLADGDAPAPALDVLGRCPRDGSCTPGSSSNASLAATLHLINGPLINRKLSDPNGRLQTLLASGAADAALLDEFYILAISRPPTADERERWLGAMSAADDRTAAWEDFVWSLLNCAEFRTNH